MKQQMIPPAIISSFRCHITPNRNLVHGSSLVRSQWLEPEPVDTNAIFNTVEAKHGFTGLEPEGTEGADDMPAGIGLVHDLEIVWPDSDAEAITTTIVPPNLCLKEVIAALRNVEKIGGLPSVFAGMLGNMKGCNLVDIVAVQSKGGSDGGVVFGFMVKIFELVVCIGCQVQYDGG